MHVFRKTSRLLRLAALPALGLIAAPFAHAQNYTAVDLNPTNLGGNAGSLGIGISGSQQVGYTANTPGVALLWNGTAGSAVSLAPAGFASSYAYQTNGTQQIGYGSVLAKNNAVLWSGSAASFIDLHPGGIYTDSAGFAISGNREAGIGSYPDTTSPYAGVYVTHAMTWTGSAASYVDLNPTNISGISTSYAYGIYGNTEVGTIGGSGTGNSVHASLWSGTADSAVDLNPAGYGASTASSVYGSQQAGRGVINGTEHALLWSGTAASAVDLNPSVVVNGQTVAFTASAAYCIAGNKEVGYGTGVTTGGNKHAFVWSGSAGSYVDLNQFLPANYTTSVAEGIDASGNIFGYAGTGQGSHAFLWKLNAAPEPSQTAAIVLGAVGLTVMTLKARRRKATDA